MTPRLRRGLGSATAALALAATLTACGGAPEEKDLEDALISSSDVPDGFDEVDADDDDEDDDSFAGTCLADIGDFDERVGDPDVEAKTEFEQDSDIPNSISAGISYYEDDVDDAFADFVDELEECTSVEATEDDVTYDLEITTEDADVDDADDSVKLTMAGTISSQGQEFALKATVVAILEDRYVSTVGTFEFQSDDLSGEVDGLAEEQFDNVLDLV